MGRFLRSAFGIFSVAAWIAACAPSAPTPDAGEVQTVVAVTFAAMTLSAPTDTPPATSPTAEPTAEVFVPYIVETSVQNVNLRLGPGMLFQVSRVMAQGTALEVHGVSNGGEWLYVKNDEEIFGWVGVNVVAGVKTNVFVPSVEPGDVYIVTGIVKTELGVPVSGIGFALIQVGFPARRTDAVTDDTGRFYAYIPPTLSGTWTVEQVSVSCTSNTMDANCNCKSGICGEAEPRSVDLSVPFSGELEFVWK